MGMEKKEGNEKRRDERKEEDGKKKEESGCYPKIKKRPHYL